MRHITGILAHTLHDMRKLRQKWGRKLAGNEKKLRLGEPTQNGGA